LLLKRISGITPAESSFSLQAVNSQACLPEPFAQDRDAGCLAADELHQQAIPRVANLEKGAIKPMQERGVLRYRDQMVRHPHVTSHLVHERVWALSLAQEGLERCGAHAPGFAGLEADEAPFPAPTMDRRRLHSKPRCYFIHTQ
jgi:hypothetical protein